ncbi:hypothetical protein BO94DRAFT_507489 [Aspergillus sclerotioniger CBS 115572]|uniref:Uncharacterized protein n=1 Tax=Aspergillus sclerotioniger CBS 115572 TaxID=1450535 RepID=A0A317XBU1_9EURO|nr:hypothetical protein BO94DRAFT_507489 [Aspergillus sclerotioniger CBS 115572]PWY96013.1 hypothetical protein BO94DRAFT_507489 [Aspergillus sclerotioniger CBS 115572]
MGLTADNAVAKLVEVSSLAHHRGRLRVAEKKRADDALQLLANGRPPADAKGAKQRIIYMETLLGIRKEFGDVGVILCAAGLGIGAIANMRDSERVFLRSKLREKWDKLSLDIFQTYADLLDQDTPLSSVAGDVYELSMEDVQKIVAMPGQITGIIRLTEPYNGYQSPFVTIPLSKELAESLIVNRERILE